MMRDQSDKQIVSVSEEGSLSETQVSEGAFSKLSMVSENCLSEGDFCNVSIVPEEGLISETKILEGDFCKLSIAAAAASDLPNSEGALFCEDQERQQLPIQLLLQNPIPEITPAAADVDEPQCQHSVLTTGVASKIGDRSYMEDTWTTVRHFLTIGGDKYGFYAVYDGHGGAEVAVACRERMHVVVAEEAAAAMAAREVEGEKEWWEGVMERSFTRVDEEVVVGAVKNNVGSTAVVAVVGPRVIVVANCGDSRAVLSTEEKVVALSEDHKPYRDDEWDRIRLAGGYVTQLGGYRVMGTLAVSRSIGDSEVKPFVIPTPDITLTERTAADEFLLLASDGLWDVVSNDLACDVARRSLSRSKSRKHPHAVKGNAANAAKALTRLALSLSKGRADNVTVMVVELKELRRNSKMPTVIHNCALCLPL